MIRTYRTEGLSAPQRRRYKLSNFKGVNTAVAEELLPFSYSPKSYNFNFDKGVLESGFGVGKGYIRVGDSSWEIKKRGISVKFLSFYRYAMHATTSRVEKLVAYGSDGRLYDLTLSELYSTFAPIGSYGKVFDAVPYRYQDRDGLLLSTETGLYFLREFTMTQLSFSEIFTTMCAHNDRVFAVLFLDEYRLYFSDDFDPSNWRVSLREGGYIDFGTELGKIVKLVSFGGQVYLFFEHGIMRMTAYNDQTEFRVSRLYLSVGTIRKDTITVCGDKMMFAATDGVFLFDGLSVKKVLTEIEDLFSEDQKDAHAAFHGGKYYLACNLNMGSEISSGTNSLVIYDTWRQTFDIAHDVTLQTMVSLNLDTVNGVLAEANYPADYLGLIDRSGKVGSVATYKLWESPVTALGTNSGRKLLREIRVRCEGNAKLLVKTDGKVFEYDLASGLNKVRVMRPFDKLQVTLASEEAEVRISEAELTVDHFGE